MPRRMKVMIIALIVVFGGLVAYNLFRSYMIKQFFKNFAAPTVTISTVKAKSTTWNPAIHAVGNFIAIQGVDISAEASGNVTKISFKSGDFAKKGTELITIDDSIDQATLKDAKAKLTLSTINFKRQSDLLSRQAASTSSVDTAKANLEEAKALVEKTEASIRQKHISAPFDGRLGVRQVNLGQYVSQGSTNIVTLQSQDPMYLRFFLPEQNLTKLFVGQDIRFAVEAYPGQLFSGKISAINSKIESDTHNLLIQATLANCPRDTAVAISKKIADKRYDPMTKSKVTFCATDNNFQHNIDHFSFVPGMFADVSVLLPSKESVIVLPRTAVSYSLYGNSVFIVRDEKNKETSKSQKKVFQQFIQTGEERGNQVVVLKGVKPGDEVVNSGQLKLHNGTPVTINNDVKLNEVADPDSMGQ